jgi:hypothetical protein
MSGRKRPVGQKGRFMPNVKSLVLDVLKPHLPNTLELANAIANQGPYCVSVTVEEVDEKTETVRVEVEGKAIDFDVIIQALKDNGASLHSIDAVVVEGEGS